MDACQCWVFLLQLRQQRGTILMHRLVNIAHVQTKIKATIQRVCIIATGSLYHGYGLGGGGRAEVNINRVMFLHCLHRVSQLKSITGYKYLTHHQAAC